MNLPKQTLTQDEQKHVDGYCRWFLKSMQDLTPIETPQQHAMLKGMLDSMTGAVKLGLLTIEDFEEAQFQPSWHVAHAMIQNRLVQRAEQIRLKMISITGIDPMDQQNNRGVPPA